MTKETKEQIQFKDLCAELETSARILNQFIKVFDIGATIYNYKEQSISKHHHLQTHSKIDNRLIEKCRENKSRIKVFEADYYKKKSIQDISAIIKEPTEVIKDILQTEIFDFVETRNPYSGTNMNIEISDLVLYYKISSFDILKRIQNRKKDLCIDHY